MNDFLYTSLGISVRKRQDTGAYEFGVILDGAFVVLAEKKAGGVEDDIAVAKDAAAAAQATQPAAVTPAA